MVTDNPLPHTLFKYLGSIGSVLNTIQGNLKFASFYELNDATEAASVADHRTLQLALGELQVKGYSLAQFKKLQAIYEFLNMDLPKTIDEANLALRSNQIEKVIKTLEDMSIQFKGVMAREDYALHYLCLSERYDSLPMWSHYAKKGSGFVVAFRNLEKIFKDCDEPWKFNGLHRVRYHESRPPITHDPLTLENLFLSKTIDWQYEKEVRVVKPAKDLEGMDEEFCKGLPRKIFKITDNFETNIPAVIVGHQVTDEDYEKYKDAIKQKRPDILISRARLLNNGKIHIEEEDVNGQ